MRITVNREQFQVTPEIQRRVLAFLHALALDPWQSCRIRIECPNGKQVDIEIVDGTQEEWTLPS